MLMQGWKIEKRKQAGTNIAIFFSILDMKLINLIII